MDGEKKGGGAWLWAVAVVIIALGAYGVYKYSGKESVPGEKSTTTPPVETPVNTSAYKDGTYHAIGNYNSPGGAEQVDVTLTLRNDVITEATVLSLAVRPESKFNQGKFISGYKTLVIGQKIDDVKLTKVSGSSLTPIGFNDAVAKIKAEARS